MKTTEEIKEQMQQTQTYLNGLLDNCPHPDDVENLLEAKRRLIELQRAIGDHWPIADTEKATAMGVWAMVKLQDGPFDELAEMMMTLAQDMGGGD